MQYTYHYKTPLGNVLLVADDKGLTGLWFEGQKYFAHNLEAEHEEKFTAVFEQTILWLEKYFHGKRTNFTPPVHMIGTDFQIEVWELLLQIPYGETTTYGELARKIANQRGVEKFSAQAVGGAVGRNNISIIIPCHRVIGTNGNLTGYAGGLDKKAKLLDLEKYHKERKTK